MKGRDVSLSAVRMLRESNLQFERRRQLIAYPNACIYEHASCSLPRGATEEIIDPRRQRPVWEPRK